MQEISDPLVNLEHFWDQEHDRHVVKQLLKLVEPSYSRSTWRAFSRQVLDGARAAEAAAELGITVNAALIAKSRVLHHLRAEARMLIDDI